ncbi:hypothetical protein [Clostridium tyrobutyricum]|uniref:hypothetical protein n=1 Tax=Clostridium tyrobutyricum TaxID=1519 RepID=UPI001C3C73AC|nr:hypothetical protein [Clostridium tyrobutyricum]MBV4438586.1 hypothetical protein [Clostridium tyrobutyricum]
MNKILDLNVFVQETLDIKTQEGNTVHVKKPSEELAIKLLSYESKAKELSNANNATEDLKKLMDFVKSLTKEILSFNTDGVDINDEYLKENNIDYTQQVAILNVYTGFMYEISEDPNYKSPQNPTQ